MSTAYYIEKTYTVPGELHKMATHDLEIGIIGAGIGGVMASIAIARAGGKVTILEAAAQLGEIGAGYAIE